MSKGLGKPFAIFQRRRRSFVRRAELGLEWRSVCMCVCGVGAGELRRAAAADVTDAVHSPGAVPLSASSRFLLCVTAPRGACALANQLLPRPTGTVSPPPLSLRGRERERNSPHPPPPRAQSLPQTHSVLWSLCRRKLSRRLLRMPRPVLREAKEWSIFHWLKQMQN